MNKLSLSSHEKKSIWLVALFFLSAIWTLARAEAPQVFWQSQPVRPGETVMVQGYAIDTSTAVDAQRLDSSAGAPLPPTTPTLTNPERISPLSYGETIVNFAVPSTWQNGVFGYRLVNSDAASAVRLVNAPDPWFIYGDQGNRATAGGWVAVYGNTLSMAGGTAQLAITQNGLSAPDHCARQQW